jgi:hypothetical protein
VLHWGDAGEWRDGCPVHPFREGTKRQNIMMVTSGTWLVYAKVFPSDAGAAPF